MTDLLRLPADGDEVRAVLLHAVHHRDHLTPAQVRDRKALLEREIREAAARGRQITQARYAARYEPATA